MSYRSRKPVDAAISDAFALSVLDAPPEARVVVERAECGGGVTVRAGYRCRAWRRAAACVSVLVHAGILAAAFAGLAAQVPETAPEPLQVELIVAPRAGGGGESGKSAGSGGKVAGATGAPAASAAPPAFPSATPPSAPAAAAAVEVPPKPEPARTEHAAAAAKRRQQEPAAQAKPKDAASATLDTAAPARTEPPAAEVSPAALAAVTVPEPPPVMSTGIGLAGGSIGATSPGGSAAISGTGGSASGSGGAAGSGSGSGVGQGGGGPSRGPGYALGSAANPMPPYPPSARRRGVEGTVLLRVAVSAEGRALSVEIYRSSGSDSLDEAARDTIARWHFRPATRAGEAVAATTFVPVQFTLVER